MLFQFYIVVSNNFAVNNTDPNIGTHNIIWALGSVPIIGTCLVPVLGTHMSGLTAEKLPGVLQRTPILSLI